MEKTGETNNFGTPFPFNKIIEFGIYLILIRLLSSPHWVERMLNTNSTKTNYGVYSEGQRARKFIFEHGAIIRPIHVTHTSQRLRDAIFN